MIRLWQRIREGAASLLKITELESDCQSPTTHSLPSFGQSKMLLLPFSSQQMEIFKCVSTLQIL